MHAPLLVRSLDVPAQPWKNGGGISRDLLAWPNATDWRVRVGVAEIAADGPFSDYPGVDRWFAIAAGAGVVLSIDGVLHRVEAHAEPLRFDGGAATTCRRVDGTTTALNLLLHGATGSMRRLAGGEAWRPRSPSCGIFAANAGTCRFGDRQVDMPELALLWFGAAPPLLSFTTGAWAFEVGEPMSFPAGNSSR